MANLKPHVFVFAIPVLNIIATLFTNYFPAMSLNPGSARALLLFSFAGWMFFTRKFEKNLPNRVNFIFLIYLFLLVLLSSSTFLSLYIYLKVAIASLMFSFAYHYIRTKEMLYKLHISLFITLSLMLISILISNIFSLGRSDYLEDSFYFGETGVNITKNISVIVLVSFIFFRLKENIRYKTLYILLLVIAVIVVVVGLKRSAILGLGIGFGIYSLLTPYKSKVLQYGFIFFILFAISYPFFATVLAERFEARQEKTVMSLEDIEEEGRLNEVRIELATFSEATIGQKLFGKDVFLTRWFFSKYRMLHIDFINLLSGAGLVGLFLFLFFYYGIFYEFRKHFTLLRYNPFFKELNAILIALLVLHLFMSLAGTIQGIDLRGTIVMYMGAILGVAKNEMKSVSFN